MNITSKKVLVIGDINIDIKMPVDEYPIEGKGCILDIVEIQVGGSALNTAVVLSKLGVITAMAGSLGGDFWASQAREVLKKNKIDDSLVDSVKNASTGLIMIISSPNGERTMLSYRGANGVADYKLIYPQILSTFSAIHLSGYIFTSQEQAIYGYQLISQASSLNIPLSLDTGLEPVLKNPEMFMKVAPFLTQCIIGIEESNFLFKTNSYIDAANDMAKIGIKRSIIKLGVDGCYISSKNIKQHIPGFHVHAVDTTGAGDAFCAGIVWGMMNVIPLFETGIIANALGALGTVVRGAGESLPGVNEFVQIISENLEHPLIEAYKSILNKYFIPKSDF
jgi:ribokinase